MGEELMELKVYNDRHSNNATAAVNIADHLLDVVLNNKYDEIPHIIERSTTELIHHKYSQFKNKNILIIACTDTRVSSETLATLCRVIKSHYYYINHMDEGWYKWEPIHYVARLADPEKLQVIVENLDNVNSLTTFSENALHILLEYEESVRPFTTYLNNRTESRECSIISTEKEDTIKCARILINAGIDINHSNFWNETPICLAVRYRYIQIIEMLLKTPYVDIDNYREGRKTVREYLKENYICQETLPQSTYLHEDPAKILFNYLKAGDEQSFLQFNNENIKDLVDCLDGDNEENSSGNMLQFCFKKGFWEYLQNGLYDKELTESNIMESPMLKIFLSKGLGRCIEHLLNNGADPKLIIRKFPKSLLEASAVIGYYPLVAILLQHKDSDITSEDIFDILLMLFEDAPNLKNHKCYRRHVLALLLNKLLNDRGNKILCSEHLCILNYVLHRLNLENDEDEEDDSENICQILRLGASLTGKAKDQRMVIERLHPDILQTHLDDCIDNNIFCYNSIIEDEHNFYSETRALYYLASKKKTQELLCHPLLIHFIHNKWLRIFYFFYLDLFLYSMFLLSIYAYMISAHVQRMKTIHNLHKYTQIINIPFYILLGVHSLKEFTQMLLYRWKYLLDSSNYLEIAAIGSCLITIFHPNEYSMVTAILSSTVIFFLLLGQLPMCAKYTIIFGSTKYFLEYAAFYFMQFVSFAFVFYIIFPFETNSEGDNSSENNSTNVETISDIAANVTKSLFYTLILFTGEFSDRVLEPEIFPVFGRVIMTTFIFCMTIILNNLLVGLIVADMNEMQAEGKIYKQVNTAKFISRMNSLIKRLYEFRSYNCIQTIINTLHVFKRGEYKVLDISDCQHTYIFDEEHLKVLKDIRNKKNVAYDKDLLESLYAFIQKTDDNNNRSKYRKRT